MHLLEWTPGQGFVWDDTQLHAAWNETQESRVVLFVDLIRPNLPWYVRWTSSLAFFALERTKHIRDMQQILSKSGIEIDH